MAAGDSIAEIETDKVIEYTLHVVPAEPIPWPDWGEPCRPLLSHLQHPSH